MEAMEKKDVKTPHKQEIIDEALSEAREYSPKADIFETEKDLYVLLDMPGASKDAIEVRLEKDILEIKGKIAPKVIPNAKPVYAEYNVGNFYRRFSVSDKIAKDQIDARLADGVLTLRLPKAPEATPMRIQVK